MTTNSPSAMNRTRRILEDLEAVRENLLALSDDIWLSIDHNDPEALEEGIQFKRAYNEKNRAFDQLAADLSSMVQQFTSVRLEADEQSGQADRETNDRIIRELNREEPHSLNEDFTYKRPHGLILCGQATTGITTWRRVLELVCRQLLRRSPERFHALPENPDHISNRGHCAFSRSGAELRSATEIGDGIFAEINLSANGVRDTMRGLLETFEIPAAECRVYMREDRDAARERG